MKERNFQMLSVNGISLRVVIDGQGPLVILVHGFPQCWYLWRHMIDPLVAAGYRVAVPDMRGYGVSDAPPAIDDYAIRNLAADVAGIATALDEEKFIVVGHDWGCLVSWYVALLYPERCRAVMGLSVPFWRVGPENLNPPGMDQAFWYMRYFQTPGIAEQELERDLRSSLKRIYYCLSAPAGQMAFLAQLGYPRSSKLLDTMPEAGDLSGLMSEEDLDYYVAQYEKSGFRGPINWYRNIPTVSLSTPELDGKKISQPAAFVAGKLDPVLMFDPTWRENFIPCFNDLRMVELIDNASHWVQIEQPEKTNALVLKFLSSLRD
jgi:pimeloyl-ACP methyl ester carboxylesterase